MSIKKIKLYPTVKVRTAHPECILVFDPSRDLFYEFNSSGSELFLYIYKNNSSKQIIDKLVKSYEMTEKEAEKNLGNFLDKLIKLGIAFEA
ncbi:PqqD family protein [Patescibacteria group bacterium]|nr:PqqD family protein [Patescibacteria group bacterium]MBU1870720.1 PqqD family protein [Patescibacteria group bacterium]